MRKNPASLSQVLPKVHVIRDFAINCHHSHSCMGGRHSMAVKTKAKKTDRLPCIMYQAALASCRLHTRHKRRFGNKTFAANIYSGVPTKLQKLHQFWGKLRH